MLAKETIDRKRRGEELSAAEIREFVSLFTSGALPDYQMSALLMAICCRGMTAKETSVLVDAMMRSGACLEWEGASADKHSTGGVGDKLSFIVQPVAAACGLLVPSLTGRGLGLTGGTADKLESIPGYDASLSVEAFRRTVAECGLSMTVQTADITPADRKMYALRDVTGTVASIPLIVASILSKKLAEGARTLVFDVKCGRGAFMKTREEASALARALVGGAKKAGRASAALVTDMDEPLGYAVGNASEVAEALDILRGSVRNPGGGVRRDVEISLELAALMVSLGLGIGLDAARERCRESLSSGAALAKFEKMIAVQGGNLSAFESLCASPVSRFGVVAPRGGYIESIDAEKVARVALSLGAGRAQAGDSIDPLAGILLSVKSGDRVSAGSKLAMLQKSSGPDGLERAAAELLDAFSFSSSAPQERPAILERIT